jgi:hypothetical protein
MKRFLVVACASIALTACSSSEQTQTATQCPAVDAADATAITPERAELLVGFAESDAEKCAADLGWAYRVGSRDGEDFAMTLDFSQQRVTVTITLGVVTAIAVG